MVLGDRYGHTPLYVGPYADSVFEEKVTFFQIIHDRD
jgi:hypothetical protein